jgi:hypothetical protein
VEQFENFTPEECRKWLLRLLERRKEKQAQADLQERLNIGRYVLRSKETALGVSQTRIDAQALKDTYDTLKRLRSPENRLERHPQCSFCGQAYHYWHYCVTEAPAANSDRLEIDPRD